MDFENGMAADGIPSVRWVKSSASSGIGNCVEVAALPGGEFAVRDSRFPSGPALVFTRDGMTAFVAGASAGEFDQLREASA
ncbi:DUF397 domain-containing protein [Streptomyces sp. G-G2]|uniref:DUF397 domain-containing protein n=1 Tax=Streptomyces sp. G-G2 TaxID=3046201 RepID=UPI0024BBAEA9|nr:DUF397 domain-containing protein [Streptomyces sp. G-G2]MDJ0379829.1 DUF397 domain-containing protein [Streptomyces sp. G-G2]